MSFVPGPTCPWGAHNRLSPHYDGRMIIIRQGLTWHEERCRVCGITDIQLYPDGVRYQERCLNDPRLESEYRPDPGPTHI